MVTYFVNIIEGATHAGDINFVWGIVFLSMNEAVRNNSGMVGYNVTHTQKDLDYSEYIMELWTNFAKYG